MCTVSRPREPVVLGPREGAARAPAECMRCAADRESFSIARMRDAEQPHKDRTRISLYDPVFAPADHDLLTSLGTTVLPTEQVRSPAHNLAGPSI
jgi:hypothetical protein